MIIREMRREEIARITDIDRTEHITVHYKQQGEHLIAEKVDWHVPPWDPVGEAKHSVAARVKRWTQELDRGGVALGAFDGERLAGIAILRYGLTDDMAQLAVLFLSKEYRRQGIGTELVTRVFAMAKEAGAKRIYVSATPSESAVTFYRSHGFRPTADVNKELYDLEPDDIHMIKEL